MFDSILRKIADGALHHFGIAFDPYRLARPKQRDLSSLLKCQRGSVLNHLGTNSSRVRKLQRINRQRVELSNVEQLTDNPAHRFDVVMERLPDALILQRIHAGAQYAERRAQFMRRVGGELPLSPKPLIQPVKRLIYRGQKRTYLARDFVDRQSNIGTTGPNLLRNF